MPNASATAVAGSVLTISSSLDCQSRNRRMTDIGYSAPAPAGQMTIESMIGATMGGLS